MSGDSGNRGSLQPAGLGVRELGWALGVLRRQSSFRQLSNLRRSQGPLGEDCVEEALARFNTWENLDENRFWIRSWWWRWTDRVNLRQI